MRIYLDPGKTTGVAWRSSEGEIEGIQFPGISIKVVLDGFHSVYGIEEVVIENFRSRPGPAVNLSAPECIGRVEAWCDDRGISMIRQEVSAVKRRVNNDRLRAAGGWQRGLPHTRDAVRHLLYREEKIFGINFWPDEPGGPK